jgi:hypothetical protein
MDPRFLDLDRYKWREDRSDYGQSFKIGYAYTILGYDLAAGTLDMLVRWKGDGGHCPIHRHVAATSVLVVAGEQHLWDLNRDGVRGAQRVRTAGEYAFTAADGAPHLECGGSGGAVVFFGNRSRDGRLYQIFDERMRPVAEVSLESLIADWKAHT